MPVVRPSDQHIERIEYFDKDNPNLECWLTEPGRLTQFGAFIHVLQPGTRSSIKHWHSDEDELVYVLEGEVTVIEGTAELSLHPGDAATFKAGEPLGHSLWNKSAAPVSYTHLRPNDFFMQLLGCRRSVGPRTAGAVPEMPAVGFGPTARLQAD